MEICFFFCSSFAALAQQSSAPTFGSLSQQGGAFGSPQPTAGFGAFGGGAGEFVQFPVTLADIWKLSITVDLI